MGEPALAGSIEPLFHFLGPYMALATAHSVAVIISFIAITALHIVLGELAPKTVALQYSEPVALLVAKPTELFMAFSAARFRRSRTRPTRCVRPMARQSGRA